MPFISIVTACFNEAENVRDVYEQVRAVVQSLPPRAGEPYTYEHIFIDNASTDRTVPILRELCDADAHVRVIVNTRNFGHIRSPFHGLLQARGDCVISVVADLQDPPGLIREFVAHWEEGYRIVIGVKKESLETRSMFFVRGLYYRLVGRLSEIPLVKNFTGFGLYDKVVIDQLRAIDDPYPYFRGLICDLGYERFEVPYVQPERKRGLTKNNFYALLDIGMLGITNHSKVPLRLATMAGFIMSFFSLLIAVGYFIAKLIFWNSLPLGIAPLAIGLYLFASVLLFFIGIIGEYIGAIHTQVQKRPLVIERERINFD
jgi:glycosyltransferase involved in cell wall biosynthesis